MTTVELLAKSVECFRQQRKLLSDMTKQLYPVGTPVRKRDRALPSYGLIVGHEEQHPGLVQLQFENGNRWFKEAAEWEVIEINHVPAPDLAWILAAKGWQPA